MRSGNLRGISRLLETAEIVDVDPTIEVLYLQPTGGDQNVLSFTDFAEDLRQENDPAIRRFCQSLVAWSSARAGFATPR